MTHRTMSERSYHGATSRSFADGLQPVWTVTHCCVMAIRTYGNQASNIPTVVTNLLMPQSRRIREDGLLRGRLGPYLFSFFPLFLKNSVLRSGSAPCPLILVRPRLCTNYTYIHYTVKIGVSKAEERDVSPWQERSLMERWVVGSILHGGPIELFLVPASAPRLV